MQSTGWRETLLRPSRGIRSGRFSRHEAFISTVLPSRPYFMKTCILFYAAVLSSVSGVFAAETAAPAKTAPVEIRTPKPAATPHINGPGIFGVRPGNPLLYRIPATGDRPMEFSVDGLPSGLTVDAKTGQITGTISQPGEHVVTLRAKNAKGTDAKKFKIVVGETIALTPPLGWNSWNCWGPKVDAEKVLKSAHAMASSGLIDYGWTYVNIDDAWQGERGGAFNAIQGNEKFPDLKALCDEIHALGLKVGIYSTPWTTSYAGFAGSTSENANGKWEKPTIPKKGNLNKKKLPWAVGRFSFAANDAKQWAAWGIDYLKYDWNPNEEPETRAMFEALRASGRDVVLSLSNSTPFKNIAALSQLANAWRTSGDIRDNWASMSSKGFGEDKWQPYSGPGHWNDPDMLVIGRVGGWGGKAPKSSALTPDEQYTHISLWSLVAAPMLIGCDMDQLDEFTLNLLTNSEVLAVSQDSLGEQAVTVAKDGPDDTRRVLARRLDDGSIAVGLFNLGTEPVKVSARWADLKLTGRHTVRDLWRQKDLGQFDGDLTLEVAPHGAELVKIAAK
jgi:alpha-galactosidase